VLRVVVGGRGSSGLLSAIVIVIVAVISAITIINAIYIQHQHSLTTHTNKILLIQPIPPQQILNPSYSFPRLQHPP